MKKAKFDFNGDFGYQIKDEDRQRIIDAETDEEAAAIVSEIIDVNSGYTRPFKNGMYVLSYNSYLMFTVYF